MSTTRFTLRHDKKDANGLIPIELVYQISGKRAYHHFKKKTPLPNWDPENHRIIYYNNKAAKKLFPGIDPDSLLSEASANDINFAIESIKSEIQQIEREYEIKGISPSKEEDDGGYLPKDVIQKLNGRPLPTLAEPSGPKTMIDYIDDYVAWHEEQQDRTPGSLIIYKNVKRFLTDYQESKSVVPFQKIDGDFFEKFRHFLNHEKKISNVTAFKTMSAFKTLIKFARSKGAPITDSYKDFSMDRDELEVISLTMDELKTIYALDLRNNKRLDGVRDCLVFSCATGLRWSDMNQLNRHHIKADQIAIPIKKKKMTKPLVIPLIPYSRAILEKYKKDDRPIPIISNVKMNVYLKEIGELAEMNESIEKVRYRGNQAVKSHHLKKDLLTCHVGRKTFATLHLELGMPAEVVMAIGGWSDHRSFARYVHISKQRKTSLMTDAWEKIVKPKPKPKRKAIPRNKLKAV